MCVADEETGPVVPYGRINRSLAICDHFLARVRLLDSFNVVATIHLFDIFMMTPIT